MSPDKVSWTLSKIDVLNPGTGYDVINPPQIVVAILVQELLHSKTRYRICRENIC